MTVDIQSQASCQFELDSIKLLRNKLFAGYRVEMLDIQSGCWVEITFIEGYEPKCTLSNILYGIMYRFRVIATNDAGDSEPGEASEPVVVDVPGVQIAPYFVQPLPDRISLEHERVRYIQPNPKVTDGSNHYCNTYCPYVRPTFQNLTQRNEFQEKIIDEILCSVTLAMYKYDASKDNTSQKTRCTKLQLMFAVGLAEGIIDEICLVIICFAL